MAIALGGVITATDNGSSDRATATVPAGTIPDGSLVVVVHDNDYRAYSNMLTPSMSGFSPTWNFWCGNDGGNLLSHMKIWAIDWPSGATASSRTISVIEDGTHDGDKGCAVWWFTGAAAAASAFDTFQTAGSPSTAVSPHTFSGITLAGAGEYVMGLIRTSNGAGNSGYTWSGGSITEQYDIANFTRMTGAGEVVAASGATGSRTGTPSGSTPWVGVLLGIKPAAGGGPIVGNLGLQSETDSGLTIVRRKLRTPSITSETDTAQSTTRVKLKATGLQTETDTAQAVTRRKSRTLGIVSETDSPFTITRRKLKTLGLNTEADSPLGFGHVITGSMGLVSETGTALTMTRRKLRALGIVSETNTALGSWGRKKSWQLGLPFEADLPLALVLPTTVPVPTDLVVRTGLTVTTVTTGLQILKVRTGL